MFFKLIGKEIKYQSKSITFYLFFIVLLLFYTTQFLPEAKLPPKPVPGNYSIPVTYEEAAANYENLVCKDKVTGGFGRLFSDYMGITAGFFSIFIGAFLPTRDKRSRMHELIYTRPVSSIVYVFARYIGACVSIIICYLLLATHATVMFAKIAAVNSLSMDYFAFYKYTFTWVLPTVMFTTSLGMLVSSVAGNGVASIPLQFLLWINSLLPLSGDYSLTKFVLRFNSAGKYEEYIKWLPAIYMNRVFFLIISFAIALLTSWVWSLRRSNSDGFITKLL